MRIVHFTDLRNLADGAAHLGIRKMLGPDCRFIRATLDCRDFPRAGIRKDDLILVGGGEVLHQRHAAFWQWLAEFRMVPLVLWGAAATGGEKSAIAPGIIQKLRPRILEANVSDDLTNELYGLRAHVSFSPAAAWLKDLRAPARKNKGQVLFAGPPENLRREGFGPLAGICRKRTANTSFLKSLGYPGIVSLYKASELAVAADLSGAVIAGALGIPCVPLSQDRSVAEFHRMHGGGRPTGSAAEAAAMIERHLGGDQIIAPALIDAAKIGDFAEKFRRIIYESLTPVDLGSCRVRG